MKTHIDWPWLWKKSALIEKLSNWFSCKTDFISSKLQGVNKMWAYTELAPVTSWAYCTSLWLYTRMGYIGVPQKLIKGNFDCPLLAGCGYRPSSPQLPHSEHRGRGQNGEEQNGFPQESFSISACLFLLCFSVGRADHFSSSHSLRSLVEKVFQISGKQVYRSWTLICNHTCR